MVLSTTPFETDIGAPGTLTTTSTEQAIEDGSVSAHRNGWAKVSLIMLSIMCGICHAITTVFLWPGRATTMSPCRDITRGTVSGTESRKPAKPRPVYQPLDDEFVVAGMPKRPEIQNTYSSVSRDLRK